MHASILAPQRKKAIILSGFPLRKFKLGVESSARLMPMRGMIVRMLTGALGTAILLNLPFPIAGPVPFWRASFAWVALVPLLLCLEWLIRSADRARRWPFWAFGAGWLCGAVWFGWNCSWVYQTMHLYGGMGVGLAAFSLVLFSLFLGFWFGVFALAFGLAGRALQRRGFASSAVFGVAPILWLGMEFAIARVPSFPWDELGYTQVDNGLLTRLAPWTGVMGISLLLAAAHALLAAGCAASSRRQRKIYIGTWVGLVVVGMSGFLVRPSAPAPVATAMLVQPNLNVVTDDVWVGAQWEQHLAQFAQLAQAVCNQPYYAGLSQNSALQQTQCGGAEAQPDLIAWPESPAPFRERDPRFRQAMAEIAQHEHTPMMIGDAGMDMSPGANGALAYRIYNSASVIAANGAFVGRYDKMHLVPFGEYVPARQLLFFAHQITQQLTDLDRGTERSVFRLVSPNGSAHRYGIFLCYESIFGDEVRQFVELGAEALVNLSDDGWYGDTSAPWQHLAMTRMRAIENDRWLLLDTNNGVTSVIDPNGVVRQSIARNRVGVLPARFGYENQLTWYTVHGDLLGVACAILSVLLLLWSTRVLVGAVGQRQR